MRLALLNECEECGRRWCPPAVAAEHAAIAELIIAKQGIAARGCFECNPAGWAALEMDDKTKREQRMRGEGWLRLDGRARFRDEYTAD